MDMKQQQKKNKQKIQLKLQVDLPDVQPESTHSTESKKLKIDLFVFNEDLESNDDTNLQLIYQTKVVADVAQLKCGRKRQEDRVIIQLIQFVAIPDLDPKRQNTFFYAIYDGHGGSTISTILKQNLHLYIKDDRDFNTDMIKAITQSFKRMNDEILSLQEEQKIDGGSTALCVLNQDKQLFIANVGDSTCILIQEDYTIKKMNSEHKLNRQDELKRIEQLATILDRHSIPRINGELAVTRSFGDQKHRLSGLIAEPEITVHKIQPQDHFLLLASDGFWDIIRTEELIKLLDQWKGKSVDQLAQFLLDQASNRNTNFKKDNMTLIIIDLKQYWNS